MSLYLPIISLVVSIIALALSILMPVIHSRNNDHWDEKELRDKVVDMVRNSERVQKIVSDKVEAKLLRMEKPKMMLSKDEEEVLVDQIMEQLRPKIQKMMELTPLRNNDEESEERGPSPNWKRYGFYGKDSFVLTESPTESTVYCFVSNPKTEGKAWFDVFDVKNVIKERNLLQDGCCSIDGEGDNLLTLEKGLAVCKDGKWMLEKKLKLKFS